MAGRTDYKAEILKCLKNHPGKDISRAYLIRMTGISKSRLTEVLQSIRADGYEIVSPPRSGIVRFDPTPSLDILPPIKDSDIRQWLILFLLSCQDRLTFRELLLGLMYLKDNAYDNINWLEDINVAKNIVSVTTLRKDLNALRQQKLIDMVTGRHTQYKLSRSAPYIIPISSEALYEFCHRHEETATSISETAPLKQAYDRICKMIGYEGSEIEKRRFGRINNISEEQIDTFNAFITHNYTTNLISFEIYDPDNSTYKTIIFSVGLMFYSVDAGGFYILGINQTDHRTESLSLDLLKNIQTLGEKNNEYQKARYYNIYNEMFAATYEDKHYEVKVLFQDSREGTVNVYQRFSSLSSVRKHASIQTIVSQPEGCPYNYIYRDIVRGLDDFADYLKLYGSSVLALEPPELRMKLSETYSQIIDNYEANHA